MFQTPILQFNGHLQTILPSLFRKVKIDVLRERVELPDGDFLDIDWSNNQSKKLVITTHGLEGDSRRHYVAGIINKFAAAGYDGLTWNCRSCSGEMNRLPRFYHHGDATDLLFLINYALKKHNYEKIVLVGFSMGGSLSLRVLAEFSHLIPAQLKACVGVSVPLDLPKSVEELTKKGKRFYMKRFIKKLKKKIVIKAKMFPDNKFFDLKGIEKIKDFESFDERFTAPLHGYKGAHDLYRKASVKNLLFKINVPSLIIQAQNDPFLPEECLNLGDAKSNPHLHLMITPEGGHVGFQIRNSSETFIDVKALEFCEKNN